MATYERLTAQDRSFLDLEGPNTHMHVAGCFVFEAGPLRAPDGSLDIERIREYVTSRLHQIPRYRQRIEKIPIENHPVWVDDDCFNIAYHVRHTSLPEPGDDRQLKRLCGRVMSQQLDRGKPLWEIWVVEGLEHDRVALVSKAHHCMIDGIAGTDLLQALLSVTPAKTFEPAPGWYPNPVPPKTQLLRDAALRRALTPFSVARAAARAARHPEALIRQIDESLAGIGDALTALKPAADTPFNRKIGPHRRFDWVGFDLDEVKRVKKALGGTVNDVVLATVAGAVGRFLVQRGVSRYKQKNFDFRVFCPVSVRPTSQRGTLGNHVSSMIASLPIAETDPRKRMAAVTRTMGDLKDSKQALGAELLASVSEWTAPTLMSLAARLAFRSRASNMIVTNVPGPQLPLYLLGARMIEAYPMVPLFVNNALGIALFSYSGGLYWGFNADWDLFPDLHDFVVAVNTSFHELCDAAEAAA
ncbi:MAG: wax ester/triacylglycerol synthase family O-acyltransferase [Deltaproteobacteria bacterium]|nr:MAG: wax ester/triacylglycerol synthase family O-acyltransferase [Deltaproteobacteria bacterium]